MNRLSENRMPQARLEGVSKYEIDWTIEEVFQKLFQAHVGVKRIPLELHHKIEVT